MMIDHHLIASAIGYYTTHNFMPIDVPWIVSEAADDMTRPANRPAVEVDGMLRLPGSGEQGFLHLMMQGNLPDGRYVTCTPCFRQEPTYNRLTRPWFLKVELIVVGSEDLTLDLLGVAERFHRDDRRLPVRRVKTDEGWDLVTDKTGIEIGSYGFREVGRLCWTYGTGLASPRFEEAFKLEHRAARSSDEARG